MKRLSILFILLLCSLAQAAEPIQLARMNPYVAGSVAAGASCQASPFFDTSSGSSSFHYNANYTADAYSAGAVITPSTTKDVCRIDLNIACPYGSCDQNYYVAVYTMNGTALDTLLGTSSAKAGTNWTEQFVTFNFSTPVTMTASTAYGVMLYGTTQSESNLIFVYYRDDGTAAGKQWKSDKTQNDPTTTMLMTRFYAYE